MVAGRGAGFAFGLRECGKVGGIVQRGFIEIGEQKTDDAFFLRIADLLCVAADAVGGGDQQAVLDVRPVRFAEEFIDIVFGDVVVGRIALGLHRPAFRPFISQPHLVNLG
jgi:hypothetical protein